MKKKAAISLLAASALLLTGSVYAASLESNGYDAYKAAVKQTAAQKNGTIAWKLVVKDNGTQAIAVNSLVKHDEAQGISNATVSVEADGKTQSAQISHQGDKTIIKKDSEDVYRVVELPEEAKKHSHEGDAQRQALGEQFIDALFVQLKGDVQSASLPDGGKQLTLDLPENRISPVVQSLAALALPNAAKHHAASGHEAGDTADEFGEAAHKTLTQLQQDIRVKHVTVQAQVGADGVLRTQTAAVTVSGKDAAGNVHEVTVNGEANLSQFGSTQVQALDLTGKKTETIDKEKAKHFRH